MPIRKLFAFIASFCMSIVMLLLFSNNANAAFSNISPTYNTDSSGIYPANSWQITAQKDVINHQGGTSSSWDNNKSWDGNSSNTTNSYIKYGTDSNNPDFAIRKYAKETNTPGLYDIYLNVKGNTQKNIKPVDIVLVVDMSGSMNPSSNGGTDRVGAVRNGIKNFLTTINNAGLGKYVNVGVVGFSSPDKYGMNSKGYVSEPIAAISNKYHVDNINNNILKPSNFKGGTFTQLGLQQGQKMLSSDESNNKKEMILLTDGVPTYSYRVLNSTVGKDGTVYGTTFDTNDSSSQYNPGYTSQLWKNVYYYNWWNRWPQKQPWSYVDGSGNTISDTWPATLGEAKIAKDAGDEIHALGIQLSTDHGYTDDKSDTYLNTSQIEQRMKLLASNDSNGNPLYDSAGSATDVTNYLNSQANDVIKSFNTINKGSISDPLGSQFNYNSEAVDIKSVGSTSINNDNMPKAQISDGSLNVSNLNLGKGQEVQIHYQEKLNTDTADFKPNYWYQMNGKTTLTPDGDNTKNKVDFGIPSARGQGTKIAVQKLGTGSTEALTGSKFNLIRYTDNWSTQDQIFGIKELSGNGSDLFVKPGHYELTETTAPIGYGKDSQPVKFLVNTKGQVLDQNNNVITQSTVPSNDGFYVNNSNGSTIFTLAKYDKIKPFTLIVNKIDKLTNQSIKGAKFELVNSANNKIIEPSESSDDAASFTFKNLQPGNYLLKETQAPTGYDRLADDISIKIDDKGIVTIPDNYSSNNKLVSGDDNNIINLTIADKPTSGKLPATGGPGALNYIIVGSIFILVFLASIMIDFYHKREV